MSASERIINYSSVFVYNPKLRNDYLDYFPNLERYERDSTISKGSQAKLKEFFDMDISDQKITLDDVRKSTPLIQTLFEMLKIHGDSQITTFALLFLDGMIEEDRERMDNLVHIQVSKNPKT